jgi:ferrochelatase
MKGILLVNLGTPDSPAFSDVKKYLIEFLTDGRVIDIPWFWRQLLVRGRIVPKRYKQSARSYKEIWTAEGSPLLVHSRNARNALQEVLGSSYQVELAMRYQNPSMEEGLARLLSQPLEELIIVPLFPQYASATTGSIYQRAMEILKKYPSHPHLKFVNSFAHHPAVLEAFAAVARGMLSKGYDHFLFSYHGLPERQLKKADRFGKCLMEKGCCEKLCAKNQGCYAAQCHATTAGIIQSLNLPRDQCSICFQSRLGKEPWLQPYASDVIHQLAKQGKKRLLVFSPSFVSDCLETIYEIGVEYAEEFRQAGGESLDLVPGLNDHPSWIQALAQIIQSHTLKKNYLQDLQNFFHPVMHKH